MVNRINFTHQLKEYLDIFPAVGILGPRQVGKTTLVKLLTNSRKDSIYLDLERASDRAKLTDIELFLKLNEHHLIILDEIQFMPEVFAALRSVIDENRKTGRFILLGSASPELIRKSADSLAGRIGYLELSPFTIDEINVGETLQHWNRGGYPLSFLAKSDKTSMIWRQSFIQSYIERDLGLLGLNADPRLIDRFWKMLAHYHGNTWNADNFGRALGVTRPTVNRYLDFMEGAFMLRILRPYLANVKKRLTKAPKVYIRDSGLLHALTDISTFDDLQHNILIGASWEGYVIDQIINIFGDKFNYYYYRTHQGAECDLVLEKSGIVKAIVEIKNTSVPQISKGFTISMSDTKAEKGYIIARISKGFLMKEKIQAVNLREFITEEF